MTLGSDNKTVYRTSLKAANSLNISLIWGYKIKLWQKKKIGSYNDNQETLVKEAIDVNDQIEKLLRNVLHEELNPIRLKLEQIDNTTKNNFKEVHERLDRIEHKIDRVEENQPADILAMLTGISKCNC